jgi:hypothetical protein
MALGTARTCSSLSSSGVIILIRLGRLPEGESRVPPPLEAARASIVLLSFGTRAGRMRTRRVRFSSFWQTAAAARDRGDVGRPNRFSKERSSHRSFQLRSTCRLQLRFAFFSHRGRFAKSPQNPVDRARTVDFPGCHPAEGVVAFPTPRTSSPLARARTRRAPPPSHRASDDDGQGAEEDAGGARG